MSYTIDWEKVAQEQVVPEGRYPARIDKADVRVSKEGGNPYLNIEFTLTEEPLTGRKVWSVFMLEPRALWKLRNLLVALGYPVQGTSDFEPTDLIGQEVGIVVTHEEYQGQLRARANTFYSLR